VTVMFTFVLQNRNNFYLIKSKMG